MIPPRRDEDAGMAMITAILICTVVLFLSMTSVALSDHSFSSQRVDRKRVQTFHAAEAGVDHALQLLQSSPLASLPCATPLAQSLGSGPYTADYTVTFTYYANYPASGSPMSCPLGSTAPQTVVLDAVGDSSDPVGSRRRLQVTAKLSAPLNAPAFDRSVFSNQGIDVNNSVTVMGNSGDDAVMYTNGNYVCRNSQALGGYVYAAGSASLDQSCAVSGDVWAQGNVTIANKADVGRDVISGGGSVTTSGQAVVRRNARAATTVTVNNPSKVLGLRIRNSPAGPPPTSTFPQLTYSASAWQNAGFTIHDFGTNCAAAVAAIGNSVHTWTTPSVVKADCKLDFSGSATYIIHADLAIISTGGMAFTNRTDFVSSDGTRKQIHLIVPWGSSCNATGSLGYIEMNSNGSIAAPLETFMYTPCVLKISNAGILQGQVYADTVQFTNSTTLAYRPVKHVPGYSLAATTTMARQVSVLYKREVVAGS